MSIRETITKSILGWGKKLRPDNFDFDSESTLHNTSSIDGKPPFSSYKSSFLKKQKPTVLDPKKPFKKYLDNPPR